MVAPSLLWTIVAVPSVGTAWGPTADWRQLEARPGKQTPRALLSTHYATRCQASTGEWVTILSRQPSIGFQWTLGADIGYEEEVAISSQA